ncbi:hypothetical protein ATANTOWER_024715 [Ataeniobius toweri]|uniref:Uncharacterized protein n=1 Tax=Ataeniobius toweri TaxID=208326 RepID=A0ABU7BCP7_9TELE|nr:hypothetical protein [Ataeniobius toweri]
MLLEHQDLKFFLEHFHHIVSHVDLLYAKLQKKNIDSVHIKRSIQQLQNIRNSLHSIGEQSSDSLPAEALGTQFRLSSKCRRRGYTQRFC